MTDTVPKPLPTSLDGAEEGEIHPIENESIMNTGTVPVEYSSEPKGSEASEASEVLEVMSEVSLVTAITCPDEEVEVIIEGGGDDEDDNYAPIPTEDDTGDIADVDDDDDDDDDKCNEPIPTNIKAEVDESKYKAWEGIPNYILTQERVMKDVKTPDWRLLPEDLLYDKENKINVSILRSHLANEGRLTPSAALRILDDIQQVLQEEPNVLLLDAPISIVGDIHGQFYDLLGILSAEFPEHSATSPAPAEATYAHECDSTTTSSTPKQYLFLGDYVDRGCFGTEVCFMLFALKLASPERFWLLRGNHECRLLTSHFNFKQECSAKYNMEVYLKFMEVFDRLPIAAIINNKFLCLHGGLSPSVESISELYAIDRFTEPPTDGSLCDILWSDPADESMAVGLSEADKEEWMGVAFEENPTRGCGFVFGWKAVEGFCKENDLVAIIRGHEVQRTGYCLHRFLVPESERPFPITFTVFSAPNYCDIYRNVGAVMELYEDETYNFKTFECVPHPYWMPHFENAFDVSVHLMMKQILIWIKKNIAKVREEAAKRRRRSSLIVGDTEKFAYCTRTTGTINPPPTLPGTATTSTTTNTSSTTKSDSPLTTHITVPTPSRTHTHSHSHSHTHGRGGGSRSASSSRSRSGSSSPAAPAATGPGSSSRGRVSSGSSSPCLGTSGAPGASAAGATTATSTTTPPTTPTKAGQGKGAQGRGASHGGGHVSSGSSSPTSSPVGTEGKCVVSDSEEVSGGCAGWSHKKQQRRRHSCDIGHGVPAIAPEGPDMALQDSPKDLSDSDNSSATASDTEAPPIITPSSTTAAAAATGNATGSDGATAEGQLDDPTGSSSGSDTAEGERRRRRREYAGTSTSKKIVIRGSGGGAGCGSSMSSPGSPASSPASPSPSYTSTMVSMFSNINKQTQRYSNEDTMASVNVIPRGITTSRKNEFLEQQKRNMEYLHIPGLEMQQIQELLQGIRSKSKEQLLNKASAGYKREEVFDAARTYDQENERRPPVEELKKMFDSWKPTKYEFMYRDSSETQHTTTSSGYALSTASSKFAFNIFQNTGAATSTSSSSSSLATTSSTTPQLPTTTTTTAAATTTTQCSNAPGQPLLSASPQLPMPQLELQPRGESQPQSQAQYRGQMSSDDVIPLSAQSPQLLPPQPPLSPPASSSSSSSSSCSCSSPCSSSSSSSSSIMAGRGDNNSNALGIPGLSLSTPSASPSPPAIENNLCSQNSFSSSSSTASSFSSSPVLI